MHPERLADVAPEFPELLLLVLVVEHTQPSTLACFDRTAKGRNERLHLCIVRHSKQAFVLGIRAFVRALSFPGKATLIRGSVADLSRRWLAIFLAVVRRRAASARSTIFLLVAAAPVGRRGAAVRRCKLRGAVASRRTAAFQVEAVEPSAVVALGASATRPVVFVGAAAHATMIIAIIIMIASTMTTRAFLVHLDATTALLDPRFDGFAASCC
jgi:hypothetical protein